ncbi:MAG: DUF4349 domain-containing protein [Chitinophaga sp.]|uniref:DUF4349 domain-containing protein n=1 Tax=Chitinophaga sp. TaxID=1869181 RepID=UPI001B09D63C|nr:DUF4349 domain-containing protein [Chitinophaga sp.]MBO9728797.1 DUF4349 domain-containing protein [Chitinophaga sp.]
MRPSLYYLLIPVLGFCACSSHLSKEEQAMVATADSTSFSNDITSINSPSRKRVKSADTRCRVPSVFKATAQLEHLVTSLGGVVVESSLSNESVQQYQLPYSSDSIKRMLIYTPTANLTLKVPAERLDSVDQSLTAIASYIEHRTIKAEDMTFKYLANALKNEQHEKKAAKEDAAATRREKQGKPPVEKVVTGDNAIVVAGDNAAALNAATYKDQKDEAVIDRQMSNLAILDDVNYSTLTVQLYQPEVTDVQIVLNPAAVSRAGFGTELLTALKDGTVVLRNIFLFFVQIWPFLIAAVLAWMGYRKLQLRRTQE